MNQQAKRKFNIIDVIVIVLLLAAALFTGWKVSDRSISSGERVRITYKLRCEEQPAEAYESCLACLPGTLMASGARLEGEIVSVEKQPCYVPGPDGQWMEDPDHVTLIFTAWAICPAEAVMTNKVGEQEVRIGKSYIVKTECIEFQGAIVTDIQREE